MSENTQNKKTTTSFEQAHKKAFDKIQHSFMTKTLNKLGKEGNFQNLLKDTYKKPRANIMLNGERLNGFPLRLGK